MKGTFLRVILPVLCLACSGLWFTACPLFEDPDSGEAPENPDGPDTPDTPDGPATGPYAETYWGEWVRVDTGDTWYISGKRILINGAAAVKTYPLAKQSAQVIRVTESGREPYFLFASRTANATLRGKVILMGDISASIRASVGAMPPMFISNPQQPDLAPVAVQPDPVTGEFEIAGLIPGDGLVAAPAEDAGKIPPIPIPPLPIPPPDEDYQPPVVPLPVNPGGVNLKASISPADGWTDTTRLYANKTELAFNLDVENVGDEDCTAATYSLAYDNTYLEITDPAPNRRLGTLTPKEKGGATYRKTIPLTVTCKLLPGDMAYKDIEIKVTINDTIVRKTWNDSVSIRYNKAKIPFQIRSETPVQGIIKVPGGKTHHFRTSDSSYGNCVYSIDLPWSTNDYFVIFSGATAATESVYSLGINVPAPGDFSAFDDLGVYEDNGGNDDEDHAVLIENKASIMAYLHGGERADIDFYRINLGNEAPVVKLVPLERYGFQEDGGNRDGRINPGETAYLDLVVHNTTSQNRDLTVSFSPAGEYAGYITVHKGSSGISGLGAGTYAGLTDPYGRSSAENVSMFRSDNLSAAPRFSLSEACPSGITIPFTLSFADSTGDAWTETIELAVVERDKSVALETPAADNCVLREYSGNGDAYVNPGESFYYDLRVKNTGTVSVSGLQGVLSAAASGGNVTIDMDTVYLGALSPGASATAAYRFTVSPDCPPGTEIPFRLSLSSWEGQIWWDTPPAVAVKIPTPGALQAAAAATTGVTLTWNPAANAAGYRVYYAASTDGVYTPAGSTGAGTTSYSHTGLAAGTVYYYRVTALDGSGGESGQSAAASAKTWTALPAFNQSVSGAVSAGLPEYYRFYVSGGVAYTFSSDKAGTVMWEDGTSWFTLNSGTQTQTAGASGWAVIKLESAGAFTFKVTSGEAAVSAFVFDSTSPSSAGTVDETAKTIAVPVPYGTSPTSLTPTVQAAAGWTCDTTGAKDFSGPVEYSFTKGDALQAYTVTVTVKGQGGITIEPPGGDISIAGFPAASFTVSRTGSPQTYTIQISDSSYTSYEWYVDDTRKTADSGSNGGNFTINAADYVIGAHTVTLIVWKDGAPYSNERSFTVTN
jgi:hypothetical protein